ncbi:hypothetical protein B0I35DRAFT_480482 [Stachybotrys elegans]|uniref:Uncharacterized protein n=1 Tax=Stachybotrys elegans TaxID=80388 RepID=A0A8K0WQK6_9HYPO|nr:hypothetical protein B0I35DRAFT_480482 [Stachybotrys elegans]
MASDHTQSIQQYLGVRISLLPNKRRIIITFPRTFVADKYLEKIENTTANRRIRLEPEKLSDDSRSVSLRLPSTVTEIEASSTYGGFFMRFSNEKDARMWQDDLLLWKFAVSSTTSLYVVRNIHEVGLYRKLGVPSPHPPPPDEEPRHVEAATPGHAEFSARQGRY